MKKLLNLGRMLLAAGLTAVMLTSTAAFGSENCEKTDQESKTEGYYVHDCKTGETTFVPFPEIDTHSEEDDLWCPGTVRWSEDMDEHLISPQANIQEDNRMLVAYTTLDWFRPTVSIKIVDEDKETFQGSGFLIAPNIVVTAGHCVWNIKEFGGTGWITTDSVVTPARTSGGGAPYGSSKTGKVICGGNGVWDTESDLKEDWAVIILENDIGNSTNWYGFHTQILPYNGTSVRVNGYGGNSAIPYTVNGKINVSHSKTLESVDIYTDHGMSGGPCYITDNGSLYAIGITSAALSLDPDGEYHERTIFRRIDKGLFDLLKSYKEQYGSK